LVIQLFDSFYYHPEIHTVLRHSFAPMVYVKGDLLPLKSPSFNYPNDFDIPAEDDFAHIRGGIFSGFGKRELEYPLIDVRGMELEVSLPRNFGKYRRVMIWEKDYEI